MNDAPGRVIVFVNYKGFALNDSGPAALLPLFWRQLERLAPETYVADRDECLSVATRDAVLFAALRERLR